MPLFSEFTYGVSTHPKEGNQYSGDQFLIRPYGQDILIAIMDGLGHGYEAFIAAQKAIEILKFSPDNNSLIDLVNQCNEVLKCTHGVVLFIALIHKQYTISWVSIGNISAVLYKNNFDGLPKNELLFGQSGVVGSHLPRLTLSCLTVDPGDQLILATDGIKQDFIQMKFNSFELPQKIADQIFSMYRDSNDDALVLTFRWN